jgi:kynurenine formamidase
MCSPKVMEAVRLALKHDAPRHVHVHTEALSRREMLRMGGLASAGLAMGAAGLALPQRARAQEAMRVVDLSHVFGTNIPTYLLDEKPQRETFVTVEENGFYIQRWNYTEHAGTHVDIPAHFIADGETVDNYLPELLVGPAVVIDITEKAALDPDAVLDVADIEAWEAANGEIPAGAIVFMDSGWAARWNSIEEFRNADADGVMHFPGFSPEAALFLLEERDIHGIGVDTLSLDPGISATFDVHVSVLGAGKFGVEGVANLGALANGATVIVGVPRWEAGSGGPCRLLALT